MVFRKGKDGWMEEEGEIVTGLTILGELQGFRGNFYLIFNCGTIMGGE